MALTSLQCRLVTFTLLLALGNKFVGAANLGVCYTRSGSNQPSPADVVRLYQKHKIGQMRIYEPDHEILDALKGSTIQLTVGIPNIEVGTIAKSQDAAFRWFDDHVQPYARHVRFRYIVVGQNDAINTRDAQVVLRAMENLDAIINRRYHMHIKITTEVTFDVIKHLAPPRKAVFAASARPFMDPIVRFLVERDAPLFVHFYPYFVRYNPEYAHSGMQEDLKRYITTNTPADYVKFVVDMFYGALENAGGKNVKVVVGENGWPSAGGEGASVQRAKDYMWALTKHALSMEGTPMRPGRQMEVYVYELFNSNGKRPSNGKRSGVHRNFGLFDTNMKPVYGLPPMK